MASEKFSDEDDQAFTMQQIGDMLIAAGYFRARVRGLDAFDKVVGGMSWAIAASGVPIEVDVNFKENANIGEKILIAEQVVRALLEMKCPFRLKPHQIQGLNLNCKPLFPIVQWLVKSVIDYRRITGDTVRNYSTFLFDSNNAYSSKSVINNVKNVNYLDKKCNSDGKDYLLSNVNSKYNLQRKYSKQENMRFATAESFIDATLLEYGFNFRAHVAFGNADIEAQSSKDGSEYPDTIASPREGIESGKYADLMGKLGHSSGQKKSKKDKEKEENQNLMKETAEEEESRLSALRTAMVTQSGSEQIGVNVSGSALVSIIDREAVEAGKGDYDESMDDVIGGNNSEFVYNERKKKLETRYKQLSENKKGKIENYKNEIAKMQKLEGELGEISERNGKISKLMKKLDLEESKTENKEILGKLKKLVSANEAIKQEQDKFKKECFSQSKVFEVRLNALNEIDENDEETERIKKISKLYRSDMKKYSRIRSVLAEKNQETSRVSRKLEAYPTRSELLQYEKRFVELYNLTNERLKETKKYYHLYNSLNDGHESMKNEVALLQQIQKEFPKRSRNEKDRTEFIKSMEKMINGLKNNTDMSLKKLESVKSDKDKQSAQYNDLLNYQRKYYKYVQEFQMSCNINSQLVDRIDQIEANLKE